MRTSVDVHDQPVLIPAPQHDGTARTVGLQPRIDFDHTLDDGGQVEGTLELSDTVPHRYRLVSLRLTGDDIDPDTLRAVPVRQLVTMAARTAAWSVTVHEDGRLTLGALNRAEMGDDHYIAALWHLAVACRDNPNATIGAALGISPGAAAQRVRRLRHGEAALIPKVKHGERY